MENPEFLKEKYGLHKSEEVEKAAQRTEARTGERVPENSSERIQNYLDRFKEITDREDVDEREHGVEALKRVLYNKFVIKPKDIPENYFENQRRIARELGHGDIEITDEMREQHAEVIVADQKSSLDTWVDYFASPDATYPDWLKYYATRNMLGMGEYDKEKKQFTKRSKGTTKPFPDLNREALSYVLDAIDKKYSGEKTSLAALEAEDKEKFEKLLQGENFSKLYAWAIEKVTPAEKDLLTVTEGAWVKYEKDSDHMPLVESLQGHGTGWCTAGEKTAQTQLKGGDFYVYYSHDQKGRPTIPRSAIRMQENKIAEVRGIAAEQNLDPFIGVVVQDKLKEFPDGKAYEKKAGDMKLLTEIENKVNTLRQGSGATPRQELTKDELIFLYEINSSIQGFGYKKDPRIDKILASRDIKEDISTALDVSKDKISLTKKEALRSGIVFHYGDLNLSSIKSPEGLTLPEKIGGFLNLFNLQSAEGLELPKSIGDGLGLNGLQSAKGLELPDSIGGDLNLNSLKSGKGLRLPKSIGGSLFLPNLKSTEGLELPKSIGSLDLRSLQSAEGLTLPENLSGSLYLDDLESAQGLTLPKSIGGRLNLANLQSAEGLELPKSIGGDLFLSKLKSAEGLTLPESIGGCLELNNLKSAEGLRFPKSIGGSLNLRGLPSAEGLELPESIKGEVILFSLPSAEKDALRKQYPHLKIV